MNVAQYFLHFLFVQTHDLADHNYIKQVRFSKSITLKQQKIRQGNDRHTNNGAKKRKE